MATNHINAKTEKPLIMFLYEKKYCNDCDRESIEVAIKHNSFEQLSAPMILERSLAHMSNHLEHLSLHHLDYNDKSDAKYGTVTYYTYKDPKYTIQCSGKLGGIRAVIYEPRSSIFYFFAIPRDQYIKTIDVVFNEDGTPKRVSSMKNKINKIWLCEVPNFICLANFKF